MLAYLATVGALCSVSVVLEDFVIDLEHPAALLLRTLKSEFLASRGSLGVHACKILHRGIVRRLAFLIGRIVLWEGSSKYFVGDHDPVSKPLLDGSAESL
jgi:hypothetical protein